MTGIRKLRQVFSLICMLLLMFSLCSVGAQETAGISMAPAKPEFLDAISNYISGAKLQTDGEHSLGLIPSPVDLSHLKDLLVSEGPQILGFPANYDLRTLGKLTPVRDQGSCGSCWSFATYSSLESNLMPSEVWNFSENNLKNTHGFDWGHCEGGNAYMSTAYLARWEGPVQEADDPYNPSSDVSPLGLTPVKHFQEMLIIPDRASALDNDNLKQAVMTYGAVYTTMYWNSSYYNAASRAYYYNDTSESNHGVAIIGWDDNYSRYNFSAVPPGDGAFIIRNSWGAWFGDGGYFHMSYYDSKAGTDNYVFLNAESAENYARIYQYDTLGWVSSAGYGSNTAWFANIFIASAEEQVSAVSFYTASLESTYQLFIYTDVGGVPTSGTIASSKTGTIPSAGYHTIILDTPVELVPGQRFSAVVRLTTPGFNFPIPLEYPYGGYSSAATANAGESFTSSSGSSWTDITTNFSNANVCIKAFTTDSTIFSDVPWGHWARTYIEALYSNGITNGCTQNPLNYCPSNNVTRQAMAAFIIRAKFGEDFPYPTTPYFTDVPPSNQFFKYIQKMREEGITMVCTATQFCPQNNVTRAAMAAFMIRAKYGEDFPYPTAPYFTDVPNTNQFFKYIQKMRDDGITTGCTATQYCPSNNVTRAAMAAFIARAFLGME